MPSLNVVFVFLPIVSKDGSTMTPLLLLWRSLRAARMLTGEAETGKRARPDSCGKAEDVNEGAACVTADLRARPKL